MTYSGDIISTAANHGFMFETKFIAAYEAVKRTDFMNYLGNYDIRWRIHTICWAAQQCLKLEGDFVDCGAGFGFFVSSIYEYVDFANTGKKYYALDSFCGLNPSYHANNTFAKYGSWHDHFCNLHQKKNNISIVQGYIPDTLKQIDTQKISFLSIDLNSPEPEVRCLEYLWEKIVKGGIIVFDDYGFPGCEEQRRAHNAFAASKSHYILSLPTGQGLLIKGVNGEY